MNSNTAHHQKVSLTPNFCRRRVCTCCFFLFLFNAIYRVSSARVLHLRLNQQSLTRNSTVINQITNQITTHDHSPIMSSKRSGAISPLSLCALYCHCHLLFSHCPVFIVIVLFNPSHWPTALCIPQRVSAVDRRGQIGANGIPSKTPLFPESATSTPWRIRTWNPMQRHS